MRAIILSVGDELVLGQTVDTNSAWISQQLAAVGCELGSHVTIADDQKAVEEAIGECVARCDVLVVSGGIGPTEDDLTRQALASVMGAPLEMNVQWLAHLEAFFRTINRVMSPLNRIQAMIPRGAAMIENTAGTAAGIHASIAGAPNPKSEIRNPKCDVFVLPGVPKEMKLMFEQSVLPHVKSAGSGAVILSRTLHTFGMGESNVADKLKSHSDLMRRDRNPSVGTTVSGGIVSLRINARFPSRDDAERQIELTIAECRAALGDLVFGEDSDTLPTVIAKMLLEDPQVRSVATAESCTGGLLAKMLTDTAGSSAYFTHGWVTYSNRAKTALLGVPEALLKAHGAVSEPVVRAMAEGARNLAGSAYALSISGIAGPTGGTPTKPVGTVCFGIAYPAGVDTRTLVLTGDREMIRDRAAKMAVTILRFNLMGKPLPF